MPSYDPDDTPIGRLLRSMFADGSEEADDWQDDYLGDADGSRGRRGRRGRGNQFGGLKALAREANGGNFIDQLLQRQQDKLDFAKMRARPATPVPAPWLGAEAPDFLSQFATDLPAPPMVAMPNRDAYMAPYNRAELVAHDTHKQTTPVINNIFDDLQTALSSRQREGDAAVAGLQQRAANETAAMQQQASALSAPTSLGQSLGGTPEADAMAQADQALLALSQADQQAVMENSSAAATRANASRQSDAEGMRSGSLANAQVNLDTILNQLNLGRADAERQYNQDVSAAEMENAQRQFDYAQLKTQMQRDQLETAQQAQDMWAEENERWAQNALTSKQMAFNEGWDQRMRQYPVASQLMFDIMDTYGEGPEGRAQALQFLNQYDDLLSTGMLGYDEDTKSYVKAKSKEESEYPVNINTRIIRDWINDYYNDQEYVDPVRYVQMGGDPSYLPVRGSYAN